MKKLFILFVIITAMFLESFGQFGYTIDFFGEFNYRDLMNPSNTTFIGTTVNQVEASDFALDNNLYAISNADNNLYIIDTSDASSTLIGNAPPPDDSFWTGMACDPTDGLMYVCSTDGNINTFYTIDLSNASLTMIGTNSVEAGVVGIAFDNNGQMYAIYLVRKFYMIDKADATPTFVGNLNFAVSASSHHGLDFDPETETLFMVSYNSFTFDNELWTVDISTGANTLIGSVNVWTGTVAVEPQVTIIAGFTADTIELCKGGVVQFTDETIGNPVSWLWTFEGGNPSTSTLQNPVITYDSAGVFDVTIEVSDGSNSNTLVKENYITVFTVPEPEITGMSVVCEGDVEDYSTTYNIGNSYEWVVEGGTIISGADTSQITVEWGAPGTGYITVNESNGYCSTTTDQYEVVINSCTAIDNFSVRKIIISPNPSNGIISLKAKEVYEVSVFDKNGRLISAEKLNENQTILDLSDLSDGIYLLKFKAKSGVQLKKVVISK